MSNKRYRYLFGPVPSRRLGRSLGVDLLGNRICSFDCTFCEVGPTDQCTMERREYVPTQDVIAEVQDWLASGGEADVITLAGAGEPTLHTGLGTIVDAIHAMCDLPVVILSNGTMFADAEVRASAIKADCVKASLSAWDDASMAALNRPAQGMSFEKVLAGLRTFRHDFSGRFWIEVILVKDVNDAPWQVQRIAKLVADLKPEKVQLNTVVRPPAYRVAQAIDEASLAALAVLFDPPAEVIAPAPEKFVNDDHVCDLDVLRDMLLRRPCTVMDIATAMGVSRAMAFRQAEALADEGRVQRFLKEGRHYYGGVDLETGSNTNVD